MGEDRSAHALARRGCIGESATVIAARVRSRESDPVEVVGAHLDRIAALGDRIGAIERVLEERARADAEALAVRPDLAELPLAGVPVAVKDNVCVAGEPFRRGSRAVEEEPCQADHETVRRLRAAGAIVVGISRMPELGIWATSDNAFGTAYNPWDLNRTPGGSSGGSASAVAAALVPVAHGNDGLGSIRIPAACCGLVGLKPGTGVVPGGGGWFGMVENGPLATTVADAALMLSVMAARPEWREVEPPDRSLRLAVSTRAPLPGTRVDREYRAAAERAGELLAGAGHNVEAVDPPYALRTAIPLLARWFAGAAVEAEGANWTLLESRTRSHVRLGRWAQSLGLVNEADADWWRRTASAFFERHDLLITPALAAPPIAASRWNRRSWIMNVLSNMTYAPFAAPWNLAGFPAVVVPAGMHPGGVPLSVQLVAAPGGEALLLATARQLEALRPWTRHAPLTHEPG